MKRKFLCLLLALCMVLGLAANVSAAEEIITSGDWSYMIYDGMAQLRYYEGSDPVVTVPAEIDGYKVYSIGWGLTCPFAGVRDVLTDVVISEGVQMVERQCFKDCTKLKSVTLPSTLAQIGTYSFQNCTALKEIELNEGLLGVGNLDTKGNPLTTIITLRHSLHLPSVKSHSYALLRTPEHNIRDWRKKQVLFSKNFEIFLGLPLHLWRSIIILL